MAAPTPASDGCPTTDDLIRRLFRPAQPQLAATDDVVDPLRAEYARRARRAGAKRVSEVPYAREAWETLVSRGVLPPGWLDDPRRRFVDSRGAYTRVTRQPRSLGFVRALAAAMPGPLLAEELAAEAQVRARAWMLVEKNWAPPVPRRVEWSLDRPRGADHNGPAPLPLQMLWNVLGPGPFPQAYASESLRNQAVLLDAAIARLAARRAADPTGFAATAPDPLAPLRELLCLGFSSLEGGMDDATLGLWMPGDM